MVFCHDEAIVRQSTMERHFIFESYLMIEIINPSQFKIIPWKNGQGKTTELAINAAGNLDDFDWRLSIATVTSDGLFSDFSGYDRNLVLIEGNGISLQHDDDQVDMLKERLDIARFSGGSKTYGRLVSGAIKDFNIMTNNSKIAPHVHCYHEQQKVVVRLTQAKICFAYSLTDAIAVETVEEKNVVVPVGSLIKLSTPGVDHESMQSTVGFTGNSMIIILLDSI